MKIAKKEHGKFECIAALTSVREETRGITLKSNIFFFILLQNCRKKTNHEVEVSAVSLTN